MPPESVFTADAAARVTGLANGARAARAAAASSAAGRVTRLADAARSWLLSSERDVRADLEARLAAAARTGTLPSLFTIMGRPHLERPFNDVLAWICDPHAEHGVGAAVLTVLAELLEQPNLAADLVLDASAVRVIAEGWPEGFVGEGMPDLLVVSPSAYVLVENKVLAPESGDDQYEKYLRSLKRLAERDGRAYAAFLLAPQFREPPGGEGERWAGSRTHAQVAAALRLVADARGTSAWGRVLCLLVAAEFSPTPSPAAHVRRARALLDTSSGPGAVRHLAEMRHLTTAITLPPATALPEAR